VKAIKERKKRDNRLKYEISYYWKNSRRLFSVVNNAILLEWRSEFNIY
jgi:hypothetical protein